MCWRRERHVRSYLCEYTKWRWPPRKSRPDSSIGGAAASAPSTWVVAIAGNRGAPCWDSVRFRPSQRKQRLGSRTLAKLHGIVAAVVGRCVLAPAASEAGPDNAYIVVACAVDVTAAGRFSVGATLQARAGPSVKRLYKDREPRPWP